MQRHGQSQGYGWREESTGVPESVRGNGFVGVAELQIMVNRNQTCQAGTKTVRFGSSRY